MWSMSTNDVLVEFPVMAEGNQSKTALIRLSAITAIVQIDDESAHIYVGSSDMPYTVVESYDKVRMRIEKVSRGESEQ